MLIVEFSHDGYNKPEFYLFALSYMTYLSENIFLFWEALDLTLVVQNAFPWFDAIPNHTLETTPKKSK